MSAATGTAPRTGYRALLAVAGPLAGVQLAQVALTTTDLVMLGSLDVTAVAAGGLAILLHNQVRTMCVGVVTPLGNQVAAAAGRHSSGGPGEAEAPGEELSGEVRGLLRSGLAVGTVVGIVSALVLIALGALLPLFGQAAPVVAVALPTMAALAPGLIPMLWLNVLRQFAVGLHRAGSLLGVTIASIAVNVVLDGGFLHGWLGMPVLGAPGVGVATSAVQVVNVAAYYAILRRDPHLAPALSLQAWRADRAQARELVRLGAPVALTYGSEAGITSVATLIMGAFGPIALAAHNVVNQIAYVVYQATIGLSQGSSILVSRATAQEGPDAHDEARHVAKRAFVLSGALQVVLAVVYVVAPQAVLSLFLDPADAAAAGLATTLLLLAIAQQITKGAQNIAVGLMRGLKDTKSGFRASLIGYWGIGVPAMLVLGLLLHLDGPGVWIGLSCGFGATAVLLLTKFVRAVR
ncbi:MATE family efflux transporter [Actinomycetospora endophytica]|uniref:Probable multidrug resistance protein NorM n=1 Tax=Actinomycetospora endophytica TaxID=2291215 RepID=A0ABS8PC15_9PSEU|nr:MATE family efflux transporter [Actinomycetospora endophytica]MCD2195768.1 MATE family efflux transporter [Actinomycetospora endophytica]